MFRIYSEEYKNEIYRYEITDTNINKNIDIDKRFVVIFMRIYCEQIDENHLNIIENLINLPKDFIKDDFIIGWRVGFFVINSFIIFLYTIRLICKSHFLKQKDCRKNCHFVIFL